MQLKLKGLLVMQTVEIIVNILMVIVAVLLVIVVLAQNAKCIRQRYDRSRSGTQRKSGQGSKAPEAYRYLRFHSRCACSCSARYRLMFMRSGFGRNDPNFDFAAQHLIF